MAKGKVDTPYESAQPAPSTRSGNPGTFDHHRTPEFSKPHSMGADTIPCKSFESGAALTPNPEKFETPYGTVLAVKGTPGTPYRGRRK
jgi:hypothetical protein